MPSSSSSITLTYLYNVKLVYVVSLKDPYTISYHPLITKLISVQIFRHLQVHGATKGFACSNCPKIFKQFSQLRVHGITHHQNDGTQMRWYSQKKCDICNNMFANSKVLSKHIKTVHNQIKPFICNICGHKSARKVTHMIHLRQHTGEQWHFCVVNFKFKKLILQVRNRFLVSIVNSKQPIQVSSKSMNFVIKLYEILMRYHRFLGWLIPNIFRKINGNINVKIATTLRYNHLQWNHI